MTLFTDRQERDGWITKVLACLLLLALPAVLYVGWFYRELGRGNRWPDLEACKVSSPNRKHMATLYYRYPNDDGPIVGDSEAHCFVVSVQAQDGSSDLDSEYMVRDPVFSFKCKTLPEIIWRGNEELTIKVPKDLEATAKPKGWGSVKVNLEYVSY